VNWVKFIDSVIVANRSFGFDIKTRIILVKCYNGIISVRLQIVIFPSVHLIYTNNEIAQHRDEMRARARDVHRRIVEDDDRLPCFTRAS
jgi:hypothetical protein